VLLVNPGCTGVRIGRGQVLTAKHCLDGRGLGADYGPYTVKYVSWTYDYAVLQGDTAHEAVTLSDAVPGEHVMVVGYPMSIDDQKQHLTYTDGLYTGVETAEHMQRITAYAYYGNSGGGVWNDAGELVGILVEIRPASLGEYGPVPMPAHSYMVPVRLVKGVL
jgi:V8-like Glu-specific endopeptidase